MKARNKKVVCMEGMLKKMVLPANRFFIRLGRMIPETVRKALLASPCSIHWLTCLCLLNSLRKGA